MKSLMFYYNRFIRWLFPNQFRDFQTEAGIFGFVTRVIDAKNGIVEIAI